MRRAVLFLSLALLLGAAPAPAPAPKATKAIQRRPAAAPAPKPAPVVAGIEFPANEAGRHAAAWFEAFNDGEAAMRKYTRAHVAPSALARRTLEDRMEIYRDMKEERGKVTPLRVESFTESTVKAIARGERGGRFSITFRCEEEAPHGLLGLQVEDLPPEEGTPEGIEDGGYSEAPLPARHEEKPATTRLPAGGATVPMTWAGHLASVSVMLNGHGPFRFAIDTGAAGCARLDAAVAKRLGLPVIGEARVGDPSGKNTRSAEIVRIDWLAIGGARFAGLTATTGDLAGHLPGEAVDGILGFGLFAGCTVTLDYPALRLTLSHQGLSDGPLVIPFRDDRGIPSVTLSVAGLDVDTDIDSGAMGGISLPDALAAKLPLGEAPRVVGHARTVSNEFDIKAARLQGDVSLGGMVFRSPMVEFQPIFPMANLGARVLRDSAVTFDTRNHRMRLARSSVTERGEAGAEFH